MTIYNLARYKLIDWNNKEILIPEGYLLDFADDNEGNEYSTGMYSYREMTQWPNEKSSSYVIVLANFRIVRAE